MNPGRVNLSTTESIFITTRSSAEINVMNKSQIKALFDKAEEAGTQGTNLKYLSRMVS
jgi:hypothetical protein